VSKAIRHKTRNGVFGVARKKSGNPRSKQAIDTMLAQNGP
jgi:hypothetical protein